MRQSLGFILLLSLLSTAAQPEYQSVSIDNSRQLHIVLASGKDVRAPKLPGQVGFDDPLISPDHRTVGWFATFHVDPSDRSSEYANELVLYRAGRILRTFKSEIIFWDWQFRDTGKRIAYSEGPTHGGAKHCALYDVDSGKLVAEWRFESGQEPPEWAQTLRR